VGTSRNANQKSGNIGVTFVQHEEMELSDLNTYEGSAMATVVTHCEIVQIAEVLRDPQLQQRSVRITGR
jgi:hypothetical protein